MELNLREADIAAIFDKGLQAHNAGDLSAAEQLYQETLVIKPEHPEANHNIGVVLVAKNELDKALEFFKFALDNSPNVSLFWASYIDTLIKLERIGESKTLIKAVKKAGISCDKIEAISLQLDVLYQEPDAKASQKCDELIEQQKFDDAIKACLSLTKAYPNSAVLNINLGKCYFELGQIEQAISSCKKATEYQPNWEIGFALLGQIYSSQGNVDAAIEGYKKALLLNPDYAECYVLMGIALRQQGKSKEAIEAYTKALLIKPNYANAYNNLGVALKDQGKTAAAVESFKQASKLDPENACMRHTLAALTGQQTASAPNVYVEELFDNYAVKFDQSLVEQLKYNVPKLIAELVLKHQSGAPLGSIMDLGCGTGLAGVELKGFCQEIEGIDLSKKMLAKARQKNVYSKLNHTGIIEYLAQAPLDFDLFLSTDVFVYVGELSEVFRLIKSRNKRHGRLAFSTEHTEKADFFLEASGRYSHSKSYIESLCDKFDYQLLNFSTIDLRKSGSEFIAGGLYLLEF